MRAGHGAPSREALVRAFAIRFGLLVTLLAALPAIVGFASGGSAYLGSQYNTDDQMVYAAWMRQAMDGRFFFDNRFTTDTQPALTVHVYYLALGQVARLVGIAAASTLARLVFSFLFVWLLAKFALRSGASVFVCKLIVALGALGGGFGFLFWRDFGNIFENSTGFKEAVLLGRVPADAWQPETMSFASMLTNSLFMVSLCLIVGIAICVVDARESWRPVVPGFLAFGILMNIHSYDVALLAMVLTALFFASLTSGSRSLLWTLRVFIMGLGIAIPAIWFWHVLKEDVVFQARAATETFSPNFRSILFGILPAAALASLGFVLDGQKSRRRFVGFCFLALLLAGMTIGAQNHAGGYWMGPFAWGALFGVAVVTACLLSNGEPWHDLVVCWLVISIVAPYFPALFQRKLSIGMELPFAIFAAFGIAGIMDRVDRSGRNLTAAIVGTVLCATSARWILRELKLIANNVSNTTVHPVFLPPDASRILELIDSDPRPRKVVVAMPGIPYRTDGTFKTPIVPDLNPIISGLTGAYSYAGHWSETPEYGRRRTEALRDLFFAPAADADRLSRTLIDAARIDYIVAPNRDAYPELPLADLRRLGKTVYEGRQFMLIAVR